MDLSLFYAKLIGFYFVILPICMLINSKNLHLFVANLLQDKIHIIGIGVMSLLFGLIIVLTHNNWIGWPILITVIGYLAILRGLVRLIFTDWVSSYAPRLIETKTYISVAIIVFIIGIVLLYFGFASPNL